MRRSQVYYSARRRGQFYCTFTAILYYYNNNDIINTNYVNKKKNNNNIRDARGPEEARVSSLTYYIIVYYNANKPRVYRYCIHMNFLRSFPVFVFFFIFLLVIHLNLGV